MRNLRNRLMWTAIVALGAATVWAMGDTGADVLNDLHQSNQMEIRMGTIAQNKGATDDVRNYGKTLASDHRDSDKQVTDLATKRGITLKPADEGMMEKMEAKRLNSLTGKDFDQTFAKHMVDDHKKDIKKLQDAQKSTLPDDVRTLVGNTLPVLQKHLEMAQKISGQPS